VGSLQKFTAKKGAFLRAYAETANITYAARAAKCSRNAHYCWLESDQEYVLAFEGAKAEATDLLVKEARRRAIEGTEEPVMYQGKQVGTIRRYSDILLIFLLKGELPEKYRDHHDHAGALTINNTLNLQSVQLAKAFRPEELKAIRERLEAVNGGEDKVKAASDPQVEAGEDG